MLLEEVNQSENEAKYETTSSSQGTSEQAMNLGFDLRSNQLDPILWGRSKCQSILVEWNITCTAHPTLFEFRVFRELNLYFDNLSTLGVQICEERWGLVLSLKPM